MARSHFETGLITENNVSRSIEGQIQGKKVYGRPTTVFLGWLLKTQKGNISYEALQMFAQDRSS